MNNLALLPAALPMIGLACVLVVMLLAAAPYVAMAMSVSYRSARQVLRIKRRRSQHTQPGGMLRGEAA